MLSPTLYGAVYVVALLASLGTFPTLFNPLTRPRESWQPRLSLAATVITTVVSLAACVLHAVYQTGNKPNHGVWRVLGVSAAQDKYRVIVPDAVVLFVSMATLAVSLAVSRTAGSGVNDQSPSARSSIVHQPLYIMVVVLCAVVGFATPSTTSAVYAALALCALLSWSIVTIRPCFHIMGPRGRGRVIRRVLQGLHIFNIVRMVVEYVVQLLPAKPIALRMGFPKWTLVRARGWVELG